MVSAVGGRFCAACRLAESGVSSVEIRFALGPAVGLAGLPEREAAAKMSSAHHTCHGLAPSLGRDETPRLAPRLSMVRYSHASPERPDARTVSGMDGGLVAAVSVVSPRQPTGGLVPVAAAPAGAAVSVAVNPIDAVITADASARGRSGSVRCRCTQALNVGPTCSTSTSSSETLDPRKREVRPKNDADWSQDEARYARGRRVGRLAHE